MHVKTPGYILVQLSKGIFVKQIEIFDTDLMNLIHRPILYNSFMLLQNTIMATPFATFAEDICI